MTPTGVDIAARPSGPLDGGNVAILPASACRKLARLVASAARRAHDSGKRLASDEYELLRVLQAVGQRTDTASYGGNAEAVADVDPSSSAHALNDWIDTEAAALLAGVTTRRVVQLADAGIIHGEQTRPRGPWRIDRESVLTYRDRRTAG